MNELDFEGYKRRFLRKIKSNTKGINSFKRVVYSPIRYAGGKSLAVGYVIEKLPNINKIISPFFGAGSIEIAIDKIFRIPVIGSDIFDILVNYWDFQIHHKTELYNELLKLYPDKQTYEEIKQRLKDHWEQKIILTPLELAYHFYFNFNLSYSPAFLGWASNNYMGNRSKYLRMIDRVKNFEVFDIKIECCSFEKQFKEYPNDFFYCDPPYYLDGDSQMFRGIYPNRNFPVHHKDFDHKLLAELIKKHEGGCILSYNDCTPIRELYSGYQYTLPTWQYTLGQGETRIGKNRENINSDHIKKSHEIMYVILPKK